MFTMSSFAISVPICCYVSEGFSPQTLRDFPRLQARRHDTKTIAAEEYTFLILIVS